VYKLSAGKGRNNTQIRTLRKPDGSITADLRETLQLLREHFTPVDKEADDTEHHKLARAQTLEPADTEDDKHFTVEETRNAVASMKKTKSSAEDGITGEVFRSAFDILPKCITALYNGCLPKETEGGQADTHCETRKRKQQRSLQIPSNKPSQHMRESVRETAYK
jgi:hypothetical protein